MKFNWFKKKQQLPKNAVVLKEDEYETLMRAARGYKRGFEATKGNFLQSNWTHGSSKLDSDVYNDHTQLVSLSRNLEQNNATQKKFLSMCETNVVGPDGFILHCNASDSDGKDSKPDVLGNKAVEESFINWSKSKYCDVTGKLSFVEIQRMLSRTVKRDGEILIRIVRSKANKLNPYGYSLQLLDSERLDILYNARLENGNVVRMGVEIDKVGKPIAYYLRYNNKYSETVSASYSGEKRERVEARDIIHRFKAISPEQTRGIPEGHAVFAIMANLEEFQRAALIASKIGASSSIYLERTTSTGEASIEALADMVEEDQDDLENFLMEISPGDVRVLPPGTTMKSFDAKYPEANYVSYVQFCLKQIASGLNVSYFVLANSYNDINFSSARTALIEERDGWKREQNWFNENVLQPIYEDWLETALLNNAIKVFEKPIPATKFDKFSANYRFLGRSWSWVDPLKDAQARVLMIQNGLTTLTSALAEQGIEYEDLLAEKKREEELRKLFGVKEEDIVQPLSTEKPSVSNTAPNVANDNK